MMEEWNTGIVGVNTRITSPFFISFHHSIIPPFLLDWKTESVFTDD
jgi:hypothetical protein